MIYKSKNLTENGLPVWELNTDDDVIMRIIHRNPKTGEEEKFRFFADHIRLHVHYRDECFPEKLQELVDKGEIYNYLYNFDIEVKDALYAQAQKFMDNDKDYLTALHSGNLYEVEKLGNMCTEQAKEVIFADMVYV